MLWQTYETRFETACFVLIKTLKSTTTTTFTLTKSRSLNALEIQRNKAGKHKYVCAAASGGCWLITTIDMDQLQNPVFENRFFLSFGPQLISGPRNILFNTLSQQRHNEYISAFALLLLIVQSSSCSPQI